MEETSESPPRKLPWDARMVSDSGGLEAAAIRNYWEQRLVREMLSIARARRLASVAVDVGSGFGRLSCVLQEFAATVVAVERDRRLVQLGQALNPGVQFMSIESLDRLPLRDNSADLAMTFTVLQHLPDEECRQVIAEISRIVRGGHVLLVEETDESFGPSQFVRESGLHLGRSVACYAEWMTSWRLVQTRPRRIEPTYPRQDVGTAMLFEGL